MNSTVKEHIRQFLITICKMWLWDSREEGGDWVTFFVYPNDLHVADERLKGKRIQIEFQLKDWTK